MKQINNSRFKISKKGRVYEVCNGKRKIVKKIYTRCSESVRINIGDGEKSYAIWKLMSMAYFSSEEDEILNIIDGNTNNCNLENFELLKIESIGKRIKGLEDYIISKAGEIFSTKLGRLQKVATYHNKTAGKYTLLCNQGKVQKFFIEDLIRQTYGEI